MSHESAGSWCGTAHVTYRCGTYHSRVWYLSLTGVVLTTHQCGTAHITHQCGTTQVALHSAPRFWPVWNQVLVLLPQRLTNSIKPHKFFINKSTASLSSFFFLVVAAAALILLLLFFFFSSASSSPPLYTLRSHTQYICKESCSQLEITDFSIKIGPHKASYTVPFHQVWNIRFQQAFLQVCFPHVSSMWDTCINAF